MGEEREMANPPAPTEKEVTPGSAVAKGARKS